MRKISDHYNYCDNNLRFRGHYYSTKIHNPRSKFAPGASISKMSAVYEYKKYIYNPPAPKTIEINKNKFEGTKERRFRILTETEKNKFTIHSALKNTMKKFSTSVDDRVRKLSMDVIYSRT